MSNLYEKAFALVEYTGQKILDLYDFALTFPKVIANAALSPLKRKADSKNRNSPTNRKRKPMLNIRPLEPGSPQKRPAKQLRVKEPDNAKLPPSFFADSTSVKKVTPSTQVISPEPTPTPVNNEKIRNLEDELSKLRDEINRIMSQPTNQNKSASGASGTVQFSSQAPTPTTFLPPPNVLSNLPIPPPLNLPPSPPEKPIAPRIKERVVTKRDIQRHETMSLGEILKGASAANLRKTDCNRSPGGTPMVPLEGKKKKNNNALDHQDMIAMALKKKFQNVRRMSNSPVKVGRGDFSDSSFDTSFNDFNDTPVKINSKSINSEEREEHITEDDDTTKNNMSGNEGVVGDNEFTSSIDRISLSPIKASDSSF